MEEVGVYMVKVIRMRESKSLMNTRTRLLTKADSDTNCSLLLSNIFRKRSFIMPGKLQYYMNVTLSNFFSWMALGQRQRRIKSLNTSLK